MKKFLMFGLMVLIAVAGSGCVSSSGGDGDVTMYKIFTPEPEWIRNGEPIEFESELWYPRDSIDILTDMEVLPLGEYRGIPFYLQKIDVRPFDRLYIKFGKNKYRVFEIKSQNDSSQRAF